MSSARAACASCPKFDVVASSPAGAQWNRIFVDDKLTAALLERLAQHPEVLVTRGPGDRLAGPKRHEQKDEGAALTT